ncbi:hypothetical protein, partial [Mesorhizobium sp. M4A.F.Ca.ET.050.02.1.1]|uniref:hypothetical protein n=1 Tax=Mesorhizobium sp. M4A.F.Ca.ET.050.02.1.1 TaxID=2496754 RepID=UPI001AECF23B
MVVLAIWSRGSLATPGASRQLLPPIAYRRTPPASSLQIDIRGGKSSRTITIRLDERTSAAEDRAFDLGDVVVHHV